MTLRDHFDENCLRQGQNGRQCPPVETAKQNLRHHDTGTANPDRRPSPQATRGGQNVVRLADCQTMHQETPKGKRQGVTQIARQGKVAQVLDVEMQHLFQNGKGGAQEGFVGAIQGGNRGQGQQWQGAPRCGSIATGRMTLAVVVIVVINVRHGLL